MLLNALALWLLSGPAPGSVDVLSSEREGVRIMNAVPGREHPITGPSLLKSLRHMIDEGYILDYGARSKDETYLVTSWHFPGLEEIRKPIDWATLARAGKRMALVTNADTDVEVARLEMTRGPGNQWPKWGPDGVLLVVGTTPTTVTWTDETSNVEVRLQRAMAQSVSPADEQSLGELTRDLDNKGFTFPLALAEQSGITKFSWRDVLRYGAGVTWDKWKQAAMLARREGQFYLVRWEHGKGVRNTELVSKDAEFRGIEISHGYVVEYERRGQENWIVLRDLSKLRPITATKGDAVLQ